MHNDTQECTPIEVAVPADQNMLTTEEEEELERYQELAFEVKRIHRVPKVEVIPIVIGALGAVSTNVKVWHGKLILSGFFRSAQLSAIQWTAHILREGAVPLSSGTLPRNG